MRYTPEDHQVCKDIRHTLIFNNQYLHYVKYDKKSDKMIFKFTNNVNKVKWFAKICTAMKYIGLSYEKGGFPLEARSGMSVVHLISEYSNLPD